MYHHFYARLACTLPAVVVTIELPWRPSATCWRASTRSANSVPSPCPTLALSMTLRVAVGIPLHPRFVRSTGSKSKLELRLDSVFFTLDMLDKFLAMARRRCWLPLLSTTSSESPTILYRYRIGAKSHKLNKIGAKIITEVNWTAMVNRRS
uniref:Uncharacterized protein n=1 Tax=Oryza punctata TaxID=4537 RepID=A0A0E0MKZ1_ORYPU